MTLPTLSPELELHLKTENLVLEPVLEAHSEVLCQLFNDPELHAFVPFEPPTLEQQAERCQRWARRVSPKGDELWLNWLIKIRGTGEPIGHLQAGVKSETDASIGYLIVRKHQRKGYASESLKGLIEFLKTKLSVRRIRAWIDTRNAASIRLVEKLGMQQSEFIKDADFFKGAMSDEWVYEKKFAAMSFAPREGIHENENSL